VRRSQKRKKDSQVISHFVLLGSAYAKVAQKNVGEIDPSFFTSRFTPVIQVHGAE